MGKSDSTTSALTIGVSALLLQILSASALYFSLFALFLGPVTKDFGWTLATFPQGLLAFTIFYSLSSPLAGRLADKLGVRAAVAIGAAITTICLFGVSLMTGNLLLLIIVSCALGIGGALVAPTTLASPVAAAFGERQGLAMGIIFGAGPMIAAGAFSPLISILIDDLGWRVAYRILATTSVLVSFAVVLFLLKPQPVEAPGASPAAAQPGMELGEILRSRNYWLIIAISALLPLVFAGTTGHLVEIATSSGFSPAFGAAMLSAAFLGGVAGPVAAGAAADRLGRSIAFLPFVAASIVGFLVLMTKANELVMIAGSVLIGLGFSAWAGQLPLLVSRYFGLRATGQALGIAYGISGVLMGFGPVLVGILRATYGTYQPALMACIALQAMAVAAIPFLGPFASKPGEPSPSQVAASKRVEAG